MKNILSAAFLLWQSSLFALNIHNVLVTQLNSQQINVSLYTEAPELYYFSSWNYHISGNVVTVNAFFIEGFGSTIAYLNNNFQVPIAIPQQYVLQLRVFYTDAQQSFRWQKDARRVLFKFPDVVSHMPSLGLPHRY